MSKFDPRETRTADAREGGASDVAPLSEEAEIRDELALRRSRAERPEILPEPHANLRNLAMLEGRISAANSNPARFEIEGGRLTVGRTDFGYQVVLSRGADLLELRFDRSGHPPSGREEELLRLQDVMDSFAE